MDIEKTIRQYLSQVIHMSLATSRDNKPWVCEVHFAYDEDLDIYFISKVDRRHSKEIEDNPFVSGDIVKEHSLTEKPRGVYFEGKAEMIENITKDSIAYKSYCERFGRDEEILEDLQSDDDHRIYKITVSKFYLFDAKTSKPAQKYELPWS